VCGLETEATFLAAADVVPAQLMWWFWVMIDAGAFCGADCAAANACVRWVMRKTACADLLPWPHALARNTEAATRIRHWLT
jgi:hypothetical protein